MPELPEVETVRKKLLKLVNNKTIIKVEVYHDNIIQQTTVTEFKNKLIGQTIKDIKRRGKWLIFDLSDYFLFSHLRMEGKYHIRLIGDELNKHEHVIFTFSDNTQLRYQDTRKFGKMILLNKENVEQQEPLLTLGLEPWDSQLTVSYLKNKYHNKKLAVKTILLDQTIIAGIGNIYADEILFMSKINPERPAQDIKDQELKAIIENTKVILEKAISLNGTTIKSYESEEGVHGGFQDNLLVHMKKNEKCSVCGTEILKIKVNGRGTYYCPKCQKT